ncbi:MAG: hypothetical protein M1840_001599 [Geoglossum simile]|nr:MAG: hypothetical protein M1840_001599 [Geoglossum simile]
MTPENWTSQLELDTDPGYFPANTTWPKCLNETSHRADCMQPLTQAWTTCTTTRCQRDPDGLCRVTNPVVSRSCLCPLLNYTTNCTQSCLWLDDRRSFLHWLNSTCSGIHDWDGLPKNWTLILDPTAKDLTFWNWQLSPIHPDLVRSCPSHAFTLGTFALVNGLTLIAIPIIGRRTIIRKITGGLMGNPHSKLWIFTSVFGVALHLVSNYINAYIIKRTPGFGGVSIGDLVLVWCTRPRVAWLSILLIKIQLNDQVYISVAVSSIVAELLLQMIGSYYMGLGANYARRRNFYPVGRLKFAGIQGAAKLMYVGALLWLCVVIISITSILWSAYGVNDIISKFAQQSIVYKRQESQERLLAEDRQLAASGMSDFDDEFFREQILRALDEPSMRLYRNMNPTEFQLNMEIIFQKIFHLPIIPGVRPDSFDEYLKVVVQDSETVKAEWESVKQEWESVVFVRRNPFGSILGDAKKMSRAERASKARKKLGESDEESPSPEYEDAKATWERAKAEWLDEPMRKARNCNAQSQRLNSIRVRRNLWEGRNVLRDELPLISERWALLAEQWTDLRTARAESDLDYRRPSMVSAAEQDRITGDRYKSIMMSVSLAMILTWVAQWLWWAGFVQLAGDK